MQEDFMGESITVVQYNAQSKNSLLQNHGKAHLKDVNHKHLVNMFRCVSCGLHVSTRTLTYFDYQIDRLQCYDCQQQNKAIDKELRI